MITHYTIYVNYTDGSPVAATDTPTAATTFILSGLEPYQSVSVRVSATTVGEGPKSEPAEGRSSEERK